MFQILVFGESANQWSLARPLLVLIIAAELVRADCFEQFRAELLRAQPSDVQARFSEEMGKLFSGVTRSLDIANRDKFAARLTTFRLAVREFAV